MTTSDPPARSGTPLAGAILELNSLLGDRATVAETIREHHSHGESYHAPGMPDIVCFPRSTDEVSQILKISARYGVPVIAFGAGTCAEGQVNAISGGISLDLRQMNKVLEISAEDLQVRVEAGVTRLQLNKAIESSGFTFFIDPGADATIGGMASTRASGTTAVRYGTMRENVLALTVVLPDGRIVKTGSRARKSAAGYDLTRLFVGAEGTLGVITEIALRLHPVPEAVAAASCSFASIGDAIETAMETIQLGISVARIEFMDEVQVDACNRYSKTDYPVSPILFLEFHGDSQRSLAEQAETVQKLAADHHSRAYQSVATPEACDALWKMRHAAHFAALALRPGSRTFTTDVCVPISRLAECIVASKKDVAGAPYPVTVFGHVGDGNFHMVFVLDPNNPAELADARRREEKIILRALEMGGTCTGEHGIGIGRKKYMPIEHGEALEVMRAIKQALDPENRLNPGKMVEPRPLYQAANPI